jgi:hypothetical protein
MHRRKHKALSLIGNWFVKVFPLSFRAILVIFACHYLEIWNKSLLNLFNNLFLGRIWIQWLPSFPIIFVSSWKKVMISCSITRCLIYISQMILILCRATSFIKKFFEMRMIQMIVSRSCDMSSIIPRRYFFASRILNSFLKSIHFFNSIFYFILYLL